MVSGTILACQATSIPVTNELNRDYATTYWPNPDTSADQLREMFERLVAAERNAGQSRENGTSNPVQSAQAARQ